MTSTDNNTPLDTLDALETGPEPSEYDQELGRQVGRDAIRVSNGELSEAEFRERHEDRLREEFGDDYVPPGVTEDE